MPHHNGKGSTAKVCSWEGFYVEIEVEIASQPTLVIYWDITLRTLLANSRTRENDMENFGKIALATSHVYIHLLCKIYMLTFLMLTLTSLLVFDFEGMYQK